MGWNLQWPPASWQAWQQASLYVTSSILSTSAIVVSRWTGQVFFKPLQRVGVVNMPISEGKPRQAAVIQAGCMQQPLRGACLDPCLTAL